MRLLKADSNPPDLLTKKKKTEKTKKNQKSLPIRKSPIAAPKWALNQHKFQLQKGLENWRRRGLFPIQRIPNPRTQSRSSRSRLKTSNHCSKAWDLTSLGT